MTWADAGDFSINKYQYRYQVAGADAWQQDWADIANTGGSIVQLPTSKEVTGLTNGTEYTFEVRAVSDANGEGPAAAINAIPQSGETPPGPMTGVAHTVTGVTGGSGGTVTFTWNNPGDDSIDKYQYRYDQSSSTPDPWDRDWSNIPGTNNKDLTTWANPPGIPGSSATVFYELRAVNDPAGDEFLPGPATAFTVSRSNTPVSTTPPPDTPSLTSTTVKRDEVRIQWVFADNEQHQAITKHQRRQSADGGGTWTMWTDITNSAYSNMASGAPGFKLFAYVFVALTEGVTYTFQARAVSVHRSGGVLAYSSTPGEPFAPEDLVVATVIDDTNTGNVDESQTGLALSWQLDIDADGLPITGHEYRQRVGGAGRWSEWKNADPIEDQGALAYTVLGLLPGSTYEFQVRAVAGDSRIPSVGNPTASGTTATPPAPNQPENLTAIGTIGGAKFGWDRVTRGEPAIVDDTVSVYRYQTTTSAQVTLSWEDPGITGITKWQFRQSDTETDLATAFWSDIESSETPTTTLSVTGLDAGGTYFFEVRPFTTEGLDAVTN